jgi:hypothetical protein
MFLVSRRRDGIGDADTILGGLAAHSPSSDECPAAMPPGRAGPDGPEDLGDRHPGVMGVVGPDADRQGRPAISGGMWRRRRRISPSNISLKSCSGPIRGSVHWTFDSRV